MTVLGSPASEPESHGGVQRALWSFVTILSSPLLTWTHAKYSTPVRSLQQSNWTRFGAFHATYTYNAMCPSLFTYAGHHNNSFAKCCFNRTVIDPGPCLAQFDGYVRCISLFLTFFFAFRHLKFHFGGPETGSEKKVLNGINRRTDLSSIWRLREPLRGPLKVFL